LPDGIFVECTLARLSPDGEATVAPAGGTRVLVRRGGAGRPDLLKLRGSWLGVGPPLAGDQHTCRLGDGDELLLATDGLYDQLDDAGADVADLLTRTSGTDTLLDDARRLLREALRRTPQKDDITMVLLCRRARVEDGPAAAAPGPPLRNGTGNVPV
jgi:serine phosphatase RsbU (regulator of sigma subunit)